MMQAAMDFLNVETRNELMWVGFGLAGQLLCTARFLVQWIASESQHRSVIPVAFWYFSLGGGIILFCYAVYRGDPVFVLRQSMGLFIYTRNLWLIHAERRTASSVADDPRDG